VIPPENGSDHPSQELILPVRMPLLKVLTLWTGYGPGTYRCIKKLSSRSNREESFIAIKS